MAAVKLILLDNVRNLGKIGETVSVKPGFARNYLVPNGLATTATSGALRQLSAKKARLEAEYESERIAAQEVAAKLQDTSVTIPVQAGEDDKLFGSVTTIAIAASLAEMDFAIDKRDILMDEPIRQLGVFDVEVGLHPEVTATIKVWVVKS